MKVVEKLQVDGTVYKGDIHVHHHVGRILIIYPINKDCYMGLNGPHPRKYLLSDNTVAKFTYNTTPHSVNPAILLRVRSPLRSPLYI